MAQKKIPECGKWNLNFNLLSLYYHDLCNGGSHYTYAIGPIGQLKNRKIKHQFLISHKKVKRTFLKCYFPGYSGEFLPDFAHEILKMLCFAVQMVLNPSKTSIYASLGQEILRSGTKQSI